MSDDAVTNVDPDLSRLIEGLVGDSLSELGYEVVVVVAGRRKPAPVITFHPSTPAPPASNLHLTPRESQVAIALANGQSNRQIASRLGVSEHTARRHTERILRKLGVRSRFAVAQRLGREPSPRTN